MGCKWGAVFTEARRHFQPAAVPAHLPRRRRCTLDMDKSARLDELAAARAAKSKNKVTPMICGGFLHTDEIRKAPPTIFKPPKETKK